MRPERRGKQASVDKPRALNGRAQEAFRNHLFSNISRTTKRGIMIIRIIKEKEKRDVR